MTSKPRRFCLALAAALLFVPSFPVLQAQTPLSGASSAKSSDMVWVNTDSGVYHKKDSRWYGKTRHGKYMLEADAIKAGYKPAK